MELHCLVPAIIIAFLAANSAASFDECGASHLMPPWGRIVGGSKVQQCSDIPWQVQMTTGPDYKGDYYMCGGSILSPRHILTAAHCTDGWNVGKIEVRVGSTKYDRGEVKELVGKIQHGDYVKATKEADIAILVLKHPLTFNSCVRPICLQESFSLGRQGTKCMVSGFGAIGWHQRTSNDLLMTWVNTQRGRECTSGSVYNKDKMICAYDYGKDSCSGDSGGALVCRGSDMKYVQVGVVSHGFECARPNHPGVYTDVQHYHQWIQSIMQSF